jgi:uncharacterized cupin superfamily protein
MSSYTILQAEEFERTGKWSLVRRSLGVKSFGINLVDIAPGEGIPEHDELHRDQEEVFIILEGNPSVVIDGEAHPAPAGTYARIAPEHRRMVVNTGDTTTRVLIVSAPRTSGYQPMDWA